MNEQQLIVNDDGTVNAKLLARFGKSNLQGVEAAYRLMPTTLASPDAKRILLRQFHMYQINMQYISTVFRATLDGEMVETAEEQMLQALADCTTKIDHALVKAERELDARGIKTLAAYHVAPLVTEVPIFNRFGRRYLEIITRLDQLSLMVATLVLDEIITESDGATRMSGMKRLVRAASTTARTIRVRMRKVADERRAATLQGGGAARTPHQRSNVDKATGVQPGAFQTADGPVYRDADEAGPEWRHVQAVDTGTGTRRGSIVIAALGDTNGAAGEEGVPGHASIATPGMGESGAPSRKRRATASDTAPAVSHPDQTDHAGDEADGAGEMTAATA